MLQMRKLMPEEGFVLMGMTEEDCKKCRDVGISEAQLYKQVGNGLILNHVQFIAEHLYKVFHKDYITTDELIVQKGYKPKEYNESD